MPALVLLLPLLLLLCLPFALAAFALVPAAAAIPLAPPSVVQAYQQGVADYLDQIADDTTPGKPVPDIDWRQVLVVEAVRREQQLEGLTAADARRLAAKFVEKHTEKRETCDPGPTPDSPPNCTTETITWYEALPFDEVLTRLGFDEIQREWAYTMLRTDLNLLSDVGTDCVPPGWQPRPRPGWLWPIPASTTITSCFGPRIDPVELVDGTHYGLDVGAPHGTPVLAARDGLVTYAGWDGNYGQVVRIAHSDGTLTVYAHLSQIRVTRGQRVTAGTLIGNVGSTGKSTGPHLHFEVRSGGRPLDPLTYYR